MANFNGFILTNSGKKLLEEALTGKRLVFTKFQFGDGEILENITNITQLKNKRKESNINQIEITDNGQVMLRSIVSNKDTEMGYYIKEIGVFARCNDGEEILYAYNKAVNPDYMPIYNGRNLVEIEYANYIVISQLRDVEAIIDGNITYLTKDEAKEKYVLKTQLSTETAEGIISENRVRELSQDKIAMNIATYNFETRQMNYGLTTTTLGDTNISAHLNFHRPDLKNTDWWKNVPKERKDYGWDMRLYSSQDGQYLGINKIINNAYDAILDTSLIWAGHTPNYLNNNGGSKVVTCNQYDTFVTNNIRCYDERNPNKYLGMFHYSANGSPYHSGPRTGGGFSRLLDEIDLSNINTDIHHLYWRSDYDTIRDLRLTGYINPIVFTRNDATEKNGYIVTGIINFNSDNYIDSIQMRALQFYRAGNWWNIPFI